LTRIARATTITEINKNIKHKYLLNIRKKFTLVGQGNQLDQVNQ
jgi:hypothetical protein